jgi:hypothetical protein
MRIRGALPRLRDRGVATPRLLFDQNRDVMTQASEWVRIGSQPVGLASEAALHESLYSRPFVSIRGSFCNKLSSISLDGAGGKRKAICGNRPGGKIRAGSE